MSFSNPIANKIPQHKQIDVDYNLNMFETLQKIIQIGSSEGVTLSKKDLDRLGAKRGDTVKLRIELVNATDKHQKLMREYDAFVAMYGQTLKNLADK